MPIAIENRRKKRETILTSYGPDAVALDLTSKGTEPWIQFSPFFPHGGIPIPFSSGMTAQSVEGIWQGLKVFESVGVDESKFHVTNMKGLKRTVRTFGKPLGHREGVNGKRLLSYAESRRTIYLPTYRWVLENRLMELVEKLKEKAGQKIVVLLDYETNCDVDDLSKPLSHAGLVKRFVEGNWPK